MPTAPEKPTCKLQNSVSLNQMLAKSKLEVSLEATIPRMEKILGAYSTAKFLQKSFPFYLFFWRKGSAKMPPLRIFFHRRPSMLARTYFCIICNAY